MISFNTMSKMTDRPVVATRSFGFPFGSPALSFQGTGLFITGLALINERPTKAPKVTAAAKAQAHAYALEARTTAGAGSAQQHSTMWAFRGLEPWRDPA
ncbi:hypothetical protein AF335_25160 [Streptomyces eurocidicus]|uniref:Uncharacterized protein n=1 Tax=Streptomyces eurocidicus TaxID=66423 RepID=A0A2N8NRD5_STREU|nr:hypothetical protein [Streptomyces eurocidicus]MBB5117125.1 hypothetical protein [Streptomyces eurocidicus]MBF6052579.1 hypothetical protein [Streptomyces eurocidicus]PNE31323.1 hypothetical protein AF335_25160 [Streptomyces eurocidicus]